MIIVLDSNEYINFLNKKTPLGRAFENDSVAIHANELIVKEVLRNVAERMKKEFYTMLLKDKVALHNEKAQKALLDKYKKQGLKKGDIAVAAFCESVGADYLVSEKRHFLKENRFDKFKTLKLEEFLKLI